MASATLLLPFFLYLLLLPLSSISQRNGGVNLGSSLSTNDTSSWVSPSGEFAFGLRSLPGSNLSLLAIWFNKIDPQKTIIWSANRDNPVKNGSRVEFTTDGRLVLYDHEGQEIWKPAYRNSTVKAAAMLDTGNFVVRNSDSDIVWESFHEPTDTILPEQVLNQTGNLSSSLTKTNYSTGRFQLRLLVDGNLVLNTVALPSTILPTKWAYSAYYVSNTFGFGYQLCFNGSAGHVYLKLNNESIFDIASDKTGSMTEFYYRATLDFDGAFRLYKYPRTARRISTAEANWTVVSSLPEDLCKAEFGELGGGACGFNAYCEGGEAGRTPTCKCPPAYSFIDEKDKFRGCEPNFVLQSCEPVESREGSKQPQFEFKEIKNALWPGSNYGRYDQVTGEECREFCMSDCYCVAAAYRNRTCWKKKLPMPDGRMDLSVPVVYFIKVPKGNYASHERIQHSCRKKRDRTAIVIVGSLLLGSSVFLNFFLLVTASLLLLYSYHKRLSTMSPNLSLLGRNLRSFTYKELAEATNGFKEEVGKGGFAAVYKGVLGSNSTNFIAVKKLHMVVQEGEKEFKAEVSTIGQTHHKNLVQLLGFCEEGSHRLLVYEFMNNGSLERFIFRSFKLCWDERVKIVLGIAKGLVYLHEECSPQIIHCDIKPQNILLDDNFTAKISDFGVSKLLRTDQTRTTTCIRGTRGYLAPEWYKNLSITVKVDVYSFGILLLEIICCRKNFEPEIGIEERETLSSWAYKCCNEGKLDMLLADDEEAANCDLKMLGKFVMVAIWCIQEDPSLRPSMKKVTRMLEGVSEVYVPPAPSKYVNVLEITS